MSLRGYDDWKLDTPARFDGGPESDEPNDQDATPLADPERPDGQHESGGGPVAKRTDVIPETAIHRALMETGEVESE